MVEIRKEEQEEECELQGVLISRDQLVYLIDGVQDLVK
jgi:hypothetical protein